jgi:hypothetical protein
LTLFTIRERSNHLFELCALISISSTQIRRLMPAILLLALCDPALVLALDRARPRGAMGAALRACVRKITLDPTD